MKAEFLVNEAKKSVLPTKRIDSPQLTDLVAIHAFLHIFFSLAPYEWYRSLANIVGKLYLLLCECVKNEIHQRTADCSFIWVSAVL